MKKMIILPRVGQIKPNVIIPVVKGLKGKQGGISPKAVLAAGGVASGGVKGVGEKKIPIPVIEKKEEPKGMTETEWRLADYLGAAERVVNHPEEPSEVPSEYVLKGDPPPEMPPEDERESLPKPVEGTIVIPEVEVKENETPKKRRRGRKRKAEMPDA